MMSVIPINENEGERTQGPNYGGGGDCDMSQYDKTIYMINAVEAWERVDQGLNLGINIPEIPEIGIGIGWGTKNMVRFPVCKPYNCNVCKKSHMDRPPRYY